tara:strand:+ start:321 stop:1955 length:1635 start_codon:yes stop_codon:yes gene_type:complete
MAGISKANLRKELTKGPFKGKSALSIIAHKIETQSPFEIVSGKDTMLFFNSEEIKDTFVEEDWEFIESGKFKGELFVDDKGKGYLLKDLSRTAELGGASGASSPPDPHEMMTAALILKYGSKGTKKIPKSDYHSLDEAADSTKDLKKFGKKIVTTETDKDQKIDQFSLNFEAYAQAISAADGFLDNLASGSKVEKVYGTGKSWDDILKNYKVDDHLFFGKKDYNSSDLVVEVSKTKGRKSFVGVSLKKKGLKGADPTVLNKTVMGMDGLLSSLIRQGYLSAKKDFDKIYEIRAQFFYDVIENAMFSKDKKTREDTVKKLVGKKNIGVYLKTLKGQVKTNHKAVIKEAQKLGQGNMTKALRRAWPPGENSHLVNPENKYFEAIHNMMVNKKNAKPIVIALANIIFKTDLKGFLGLRGVPKDEFKFTLITGKGQFKNGKIEPGNADELQEMFTTSIIVDALNDAKTTYKVTGEDPQGRTTRQAYMSPKNPSKLFFKIYMGTLDLADLEVRYKGSITGEPQFFAVITPNFKKKYATVKGKAKSTDKW